MVAVTRRATIADLDALPDDWQRYELFDGEIFVAASPTYAHQYACRAVNRLLDAWVVAHGSGEVFFAPFAVVIGTSVAEPDVLVLPPGFQSDLRPDNRYGGVPLLVAEVLSPSNRTHDTVRKLNHYARAGIPEYWVVDPILRTLDVLALVDGAYDPLAPDEHGHVASRVLPGLVVDPATLFQPIGAPPTAG